MKNQFWKYNFYKIVVYNEKIIFKKWRNKLLTAWAHLGKYHLELTSRCVCKTPSTTVLSTTSVPITAGLWGFGYFLQAAVATVSQGWLQLKNQWIFAINFTSTCFTWMCVHLSRFSFLINPKDMSIKNNAVRFEFN